jgi:hypothetical protein
VTHGRRASRAATLIALASLAPGCSEELDAGSTRPSGPLPVDARNPLLITNDGPRDNWQGEYAMLLANSGGPSLAGIVVSASPPWPDLRQNIAGFRELVSAARESGMRNIPDPVSSVSAPLERPASGEIEHTRANRSEGALFILKQAARLALPYRPLVIATGGRLTDIADAYLIDPTIVEKVVVVSSLGSISDGRGLMGRPNGEMDPWAGVIVASRFRYVQVSAYYDQLTDVPDSRVSELPPNAFGRWIAGKRASILELPEAGDQGAVLAAGLEGFAISVERVTPALPAGPDLETGPELAPDLGGAAWLVTKSAHTLATARFWGVLLDRSTFSD